MGQRIISWTLPSILLEKGPIPQRPLMLRHRLIRTFQADAEGKTTDEIIAKLLEDVSSG